MLCGVALPHDRAQLQVERCRKFRPEQHCSTPTPKCGGATALLTRPQDLVLRETKRFSHYGRDINDANSTELMKDRGHSSSSVRSMSSQSLDTADPGSMGSSIAPNAVQ